MSNDMIERVARALCVYYECNPDALINMLDGEPLWTIYKPEAFAAIKAMRQPTEAMLDAEITSSHPSRKEVWRGMIEAALSP
jgi:hypothetical protein